jgi:hypothetical protein
MSLIFKKKGGGKQFTVNFEVSFGTVRMLRPLATFRLYVLPPSWNLKNEEDVLPKRRCHCPHPRAWSLRSERQVCHCKWATAMERALWASWKRSKIGKCRCDRWAGKVKSSSPRRAQLGRLLRNNAAAAAAEIPIATDGPV